MPSPSGTQETGKLGCGTILALAFVGLFWILITLAAVGRAHVVGWPGFSRTTGPWRYRRYRLRY